MFSRSPFHPSPSVFLRSPVSPITECSSITECILRSPFRPITGECILMSLLRPSRGCVSRSPFLPVTEYFKVTVFAHHRVRFKGHRFAYHPVGLKVTVSPIREVCFKITVFPIPKCVSRSPFFRSPSVF